MTITSAFAARVVPAPTSLATMGIFDLRVALGSAVRTLDASAVRLIQNELRARGVHA